jgi:hypothetical protein
MRRRATMKPKQELHERRNLVLDQSFAMQHPVNAMASARRPGDYRDACAECDVAASIASFHERVMLRGGFLGESVIVAKMAAVADGLRHRPHTLSGQRKSHALFESDAEFSRSRCRLSWAGEFSHAKSDSGI